jgi:four helix bundle protein
MRNYKNYNIWELAHQLTLEIYKISVDFSQTERFGLTSQIKRASTSIGLNIVEGSARQSDKEFARFLYIASGSAAETEYLIQLLQDLKIIEPYMAINLQQKTVALRKMIYKLIQSFS